MATLGGTKMTLVDVAKQKDPNGKAAALAEVLAQTNEVLDDMTVVEANGDLWHQMSKRASLPTITNRAFNEGVATSKSTYENVREGIAIFEGWSQVDSDELSISNNKAAFRKNADMGFIEAINQGVKTDLFYGNSSTNSKKFDGLATRFSSSAGEFSQQIILGGAAAGQTDCTSIWLVVWSPSTVFGIYPQGSNAGLVTKRFASGSDGGNVVLDSLGNPYEGEVTKYQQKIGLAIHDARYIVRIANIDTSLLTKDASGASADLVDKITEALDIPPNLTIGNAAFLMNRSTKSWLRRQVANRGNLRIGMDEVFGKRVMTIDGVPVRRVDEILNTETAIS